MLFEGPKLAKTAANHTPLSPVSILKRIERVHPNLPAQVHGSIRRNWGEVAARCKRLASALARRGVSKGDTVALIKQAGNRSNSILKLSIEKPCYNSYPPMS